MQFDRLQAVCVQALADSAAIFAGLIILPHARKSPLCFEQTLERSVFDYTSIIKYVDCVEQFKQVQLVD